MPTPDTDAPSQRQRKRAKTLDCRCVQICASTAWGGHCIVPGRSHGSSALHHIQPMAHANSRALSRHAPRAGDKGLGRNGIPKPAGAGGGSSSLSLEPFEGLTRFIHLEITLRLRPKGCSRLPFSLRSGNCSSSKTSARRIASLRRQRHYRAGATKERSRPHGRRKSTTPGPPFAVVASLLTFSHYEVLSLPTVLTGGGACSQFTQLSERLCLSASADYPAAPPSSR